MRFGVLLALSLGLAACAGAQRDGVGPLGSGAFGVGPLLAAVFGAAVEDLSPQDEVRAEGALERALVAPVGRTVTWRNPDKEAYGAITAVRESWSEDGQPCREYQAFFQVDDRHREGSAVVCRDAEGGWRLAG